ncbi:hypothetical protein RHMOL_Rhmol07G0215900 [Rhododendron molle]|uniref:Uncharacterized protein n=1 Tax=Rhododendron molle TaxID=49168 RepID=A0ACC0N367_RHOML|nr:hypothetical protein RHMOL_Rhmol07G0215900 [Rhododendron molle]
MWKYSLVLVLRNFKSSKEKFWKEDYQRKGNVLLRLNFLVQKTFLMYVEPVFSNAGNTIGVNYMGMEVTDQVRKREKMAKLREEIAVQKARETKLNKTIHTTGLSLCSVLDGFTGS